MSERMKRIMRRRWPAVVTEALRDYDPGDVALLKLERETQSPKQMAMLLRLAAIAHLTEYPRDANYRGYVN